MITLSSDFGAPYPAAMKGVILGRTDAQLVDVSHEFPRHDLRAAAFWLREVLPWFPPAVHLVVVDPGVGTDRDALVVRAGRHALVGPDNGVLMPAARVLAGDDELQAHRIDDGDAASSTFHGRDVFAPAAGEVHETGLARLGDLDRLSPVDGIEDLRLPAPTIEDDRSVGEVLVVDDFGNAITSVPGDAVRGRGSVHVEAGDTDDSVPVGETFASVPEGQRLVTVGSHGNVELDVNRGRGDRAFGVGPGDRVVIRW